MSARAWHELGSHRPTDLGEERLQLHWAAQALSAATHAAIERKPGDSHTNLGWDHDGDAFVTHPFPGGHVAALVLPDFALHWRADDGATLASFALEGKTLDAARAWLAELVRPTVDRLPEGPAPLRDYDMPPHPIAEGEPFTGGDRGRRVELAHWYANSDLALSEVANTNPGSSDVRTWPHHFDIGLLINFDPAADPEEARSIGVGLSPGDETSSPQPYYYVNPYPRPRDAELPSLPHGGRWEQESFLGAMLTGDALLDGGDPAGQRERVRTFLRAAIEASQKLLGL